MLEGMSRADGSPTMRARRQPPAFRQVSVGRVERLGPRMARLTLTGGDLADMTLSDPAASVRLLLPSPGADDLVMPSWNGNEFLLPDGRRPVLRTFTPRRFDPDDLELDLEIVLHGTGVASEWADAARPGDRAALSGPGRGYTVDLTAPAYVLAGDESAIPAISQLLEALPATMPVQVHIELADPAARLALPDHPAAAVEWHDLPDGAPPGDALVAAVRAADLAPDARVWAAGEAAAVQRIRRHLFEERGLPRVLTSVRGYWKHGRSGESED
jgi:NADPH-dependent ferric siderophore reductase